MQQQRQQRPQPQDINKQPELLQRFAAPPPCAPHPLFINIRQPQHIIQNFCKRFAEENHRTIKENYGKIEENHQKFDENHGKN